MDDQKKDENSPKPPTYFSYGPYRSNQQEQPVSEQSTEEQSFKTLPSSASTEGQEITAAPIISHNQEATKSNPVKPPFRGGIFVGFIIGALVVGGLMFASDKTNLFTKANQATDNATQTEMVNGQNANYTNSDSANANELNTVMNIVRPNHIADIAKKASPAVVKVEAYSKVSGSSRGNNLFFNDPFFRQFFGEENNENNSDSGTLRQTGMGTGFIFEKSGYILTNEHVINGADEIRVTVEGYEKPFVAKLLGNSYELDLAALKIEGEKDFSILPLGDTDTINVGDWVIAIGNPYGFEHTVTVGVLSAKERPISIPDENGTRNYDHLLQTDASINPGNSGGPLLNLKGEVIGINTAVNAQAQGIGFAIPTSTISAVLDNLKNNVTIPKAPAPYIGVSLQDIDQSWLNDLKLQTTDGALINGVERKSPAFKAGLRPYDVILEINQQALKTANEVVTKIKTFKVGDKVKIGIMRDGQQIEITVEVGDRNQTN